MERVSKDEARHSEETNKEGDGVGVFEEFIQRFLTQSSIESTPTPKKNRAIIPTIAAHIQLPSIAIPITSITIAMRELIR